MLDQNKAMRRILKECTKDDIYEIHAFQREMLQGERMEELEQYAVVCEAEGCDSLGEIEVKVSSGSDKDLKKYTMLLCESHAKLMKRGTHFKTKVITKDTCK